MNLLKFDNREEVPIKWVKMILEKWSYKLKGEPKKDGLVCYLEHYLGLVERYTKELGDYSDVQEAIKIIASLVEDYPRELDRISELSTNKTLWMFWQKLLKEHKSIIASTSLEIMLEA